MDWYSFEFVEKNLYQMKTIKLYITALFLPFLLTNGFTALYIYEWDNKIEEVGNEEEKQRIEEILWKSWWNPLVILLIHLERLFFIS